MMFDGRTPLIWSVMLLSPCVACLLIGISIGIFVRGCAGNYGYEQGQIDAASGKQFYHLVEQPDGSSKWERKVEP